MEEHGRLSPETLKALQENGWDPAFAGGFYDTLGPTGLERLASDIASNPYSDPAFFYRDHPDEAKKVLAALGTGLATYSRDHHLDDAWLDRFVGDPDSDDPRGRMYRPDLLAPLLAGANGGAFSADFLQAVGNRMLHPNNPGELDSTRSRSCRARPTARRSTRSTATSAVRRSPTWCWPPRSACGSSTSRSPS
jgi:hypothetical protein